MKAVITGGAGFLGRRLAATLLAGATADEIVLFDQVAVAEPDPRAPAVVGDVTDATALGRVIDDDTGNVFHLAAMVSGGAEVDFDGGMRANLDGTRAVLEACRALRDPPRVVFASSIAAYGGALPATVTDETPLTPQTSYGVAKAIGELLINDYSPKASSTADRCGCRRSWSARDEPTPPPRRGVAGSSASRCRVSTWRVR